MDERTRAIFAGEPMSGARNQYGETAIVELNRIPIPLVAYVPTRWNAFDAGAKSDVLEPELLVPMSSRDWFRGRDPVLRAVLRGAR